MKRICGVRTVKGVMTFCGAMSVVYFLIKIFTTSMQAKISVGNNVEDVTRLFFYSFVTIVGMFFLKFTFRMLRRFLVRICFIVFLFSR